MKAIVSHVNGCITQFSWELTLKIRIAAIALEEDVCLFITCLWEDTFGWLLL